MEGIINSEEILFELTDKLLIQGQQNVLINGPERSGKTTLVNLFCDNLRSDGWSIITFEPDQFDFSKDLFEQFISILLIGIRKKVGKKEFLNFLKSRNLNNIVKSKLKTNNRANAFRYYFKQSYKNYDIDKKELLNIQTLKEINEVIKKLQVKIFLIFNDFENYEMLSNWSEYSVIKKINKYLTEAKKITTFNFKNIEDIQKNYKLNLDDLFNSIIDLNKNEVIYKHPNNQVNFFISNKKIKNLFTINSINESLSLYEKWLKRNYNFHDNYEDKILYYDEIYFIIWFLHYIKIENEELFNSIQENIQVYDLLRKKTITAEEIDSNLKFGNLKYIKLLLKTRGFEFEGIEKYSEIVKMLDTPFKNKVPIFITVESKPNLLNIINEYAFIFIFECLINNVENVIDDLSAETLLINFEDNQEDLFIFSKCLNPRTIKQIKKSSMKEIYDLSIFNIIKELIKKI
ncbi:ATP-binding protein [Spiroplasma diminutum]|uniref:Uncharacterized protein n=1 Tax=Spiroplasma diminutum CUAS-1 TaxID=1276221 RepID=S5MJD1_9MOLU|nr:ATP-binding protein [Spiroplasma diminutum]AGR42085.1 hypothetical protein SDIMI_v3c03810 [Spiroplasma diminutum CUAS-1]